jgi:hypothetical protein
MQDMRREGPYAEAGNLREEQVPLPTVAVPDLWRMGDRRQNKRRIAMITIRKQKVYFSGKDEVWLEETAASLGLSCQETFTGLMWEHLMRLARQGEFLKIKKGSK